MRPEVLLRLTLLQFERAQQSASPSDAEAISPPTTHKPVVASTDKFRDVFLTLWADELGRRVNVNSSIKEVLHFLLPGQWAGEGCDNYYLRDETSENADLYYVSKHSSTQQLLHQPQSAKGSFFQILDELVELLQPKFAEQLVPFAEWTGQLDSSLVALKIAFVTLQSALLHAFCEVDKQLSGSRRQGTWEQTREEYCCAVCDLCELLDAQLFTLVNTTIVMHLNSACLCTTTQIFPHQDIQNSESAADAICTLIAKRLDSIAASVAAKTGFASTYPSEAKRIQLSSSLTSAQTEKIRHSFTCYAEKLKASAIEAREGELDHSSEPVDVQSKLQSQSNETTAAQRIAVDRKAELVNLVPASFAQACAPVTQDQAYSLIAPPEKDTVLSRASAVAAEDADLLAAVKQMLADQYSKEAATRGGAHLTTRGNHSNNASSASYFTDAPNAPVQNASLQLPSTDLVPTPQQKGSHKETWTFWTRLQRKLQLDDGTIQRASERCKFDNESPVAGVFLVDMDVRNNDRATVAFVEAARELLPKDATAQMSAKNNHLFSDACVEFANELLVRTRELQTALPFLSERMSGVLLGTLYAALRADKQFQSLRQIYQQTRQRANSALSGASDHALLVNVETLIRKRVEFLAKLASEDETSATPVQKSGGEAGEPKRRWSVSHSVSSAGAQHENEMVAMPRNAGRVTAGTGDHARPAPSKERRRPSVVAALSNARRSSSRGTMPPPPPETRIEDVYQQACRFYSVAANGALLRQLQQTKENFFTTLDLSSNYVGVKGLKPVLALLHFNADHLISLSVRSNNLDNEDIAEVCRALEGSAGQNLVHLDLSFNSFSSSLFPILQRLIKQLDHLDSIALKGTLLSPQMVQELEMAVASKAAHRCYTTT